MAVSGCPHHGRGILPDHPVTPTVEDVIAGVDIELAFALDLIRANW